MGGRGVEAWGMGVEPVGLSPSPTLNLLKGQSHRSPTSTYIVKQAIVITFLFNSLSHPFYHISSALTHQTPNGGNLLKEHSAVAWFLNSALRETLDSQVLEKLYKFVVILPTGVHQLPPN